MINKLKNGWRELIHSPLPVKASMTVMGTGQIMNHQFVKGIMYLAVLSAAIWYFIIWGIQDITGFFTLGSVEADPWLQIEGDNSVIMLLRGILAFMILIGLIIVYILNVKDAKNTCKEKERGAAPLGFQRDFARFADRKFYFLVLIIPVITVVLFSVVPILFMILIAFTNYGGDIVPPALVDWIGTKNFKTILSLSEVSKTFWKILGWNILWAFASTFINYFLGLFLAMLLNKDCVKGKKIWRAFPILAYAIPGFITLLGFKFMFSYSGPINHYITTVFHHSAIGFLDLDAKWSARIIGLLVNAWVSVPTSMLLATGILSNRNVELYEAASIDGASKWKQFTKLTLPYVIFATTPVLITNFINNFNNFGTFFFLRGDLITDGYFYASNTDLLINWLYNLSISNNYYNIGAAVSLIIFVITSIFSLVVYVNSKSYKKEDTYR